MINIAINGFGRIGRTVFKAALKKKGICFVAINDLADTKSLAYLLKYDTSFGEFKGCKISYDKNHLIIDKRKIPVYAEREPGKLPWKKHKVDIVLECTGRFVTEELAMPHIKEAGAKRVILSAPAKGGNIPTYLLGVNAHKLNKSDLIISNASCTTNGIAPVAEILKDSVGIKKMMMSTVHAYTSGGGSLQDGPNKDPRRGRAAAMNIIPTTTGAAIATTKVIPELEGKFDGIAIRVPVLLGSIADFVVVTKRNTTIEEVNNVFKKAAKQKKYQGILGVTNEPLVSSDFIGTTHSCIVDLGFTRVVDGNLLKVMSWYDNEWAYSTRLAELAHTFGKIIKK